ncbi:MAG: TolC family protein, partial [Pseudomonadota bacterium]
MVTKRFYQLASAALCLTALVSVPTAVAKPLSQVLREVVHSSPEIGALKANRRAIDEEYEAARGLGRPKLDVEAGAGYIWTDQTSGAGLDGFEDDTARRTFGGTLNVPLFDGFKTQAETSRQSARVHSARYRVIDTVNSVSLQAIRAYLEVQRTGEIVAIAEQNVRDHLSILRLMDRRVEAGGASKADRTQAQARLFAARAATTRTRAQHRDAISLYVAVTGEMPGQLHPVSAPQSRLPASLDEAV